MTDQNDIAIPQHLQELVHPSPSGTKKLLAAWEGLNIETQIAIFKYIENAASVEWLYWGVRAQLQKFALDSENAYLRYIAAKEYEYVTNDSSEELKAIKNKIENDPCPLVRYSLLENVCASRILLQPGGKELQNAEEFFSLPHEARLAVVRKLSNAGENIAEIISTGIENHLKAGQVSEEELAEILADYLSNPNFLRRHKKFIDGDWVDGWAAHQAGQDVQCLWELIPKAPQSIADELIRRLPEDAGLADGIPPAVLAEMNNYQLTTLLGREDVQAIEFRKRVFWDADWSVKRPFNPAFTACQFNFQVSNEEFAEILGRPDKERISILETLVYTNQLNLFFYEAIADILNDSEENVYAEAANQSFSSKLENLEGWRREKELKALRLYRLAKKAVPWEPSDEKYPPEGKLDFLSELAVECDTWATFMAFTEAWNRSRFLVSDNDLPRIWELDEEEIDDQSYIEPIEEQNPKYLEQIQEKLIALERGQFNLKALLVILFIGMVWLLVTKQ